MLVLKCTSAVLLLTAVSVRGHSVTYPAEPSNWHGHFSRVPSFDEHPVSYGKWLPAARKVAVVDLIAAGDSGVTGKLIVEQLEFPEAVLITGHIQGLKKGLHGFHVHENGELGNDCRDAGGHFNPFQANHGSPESQERHVGDLGNVLTLSDDYTTEVTLIDRIITLRQGKEENIVGLSFVVHAGEDDLGLVGDEGSLTTGNAGARLACGVIKLV